MEMESMNKALFLDLDHTLIKPKSGNTFPKDKNDWELAYTNVIPRIHSYYAKGYRIIIVTNQGGVEANFISLQDLQEKLDDVKHTLENPKAGTDYIHYYYCPSMRDYYRKPSPGMAYQAAIDHALNLRECVMVGDRDSDREFAGNANIGKFFSAEEFFKNYK